MISVLQSPAVGKKKKKNFAEGKKGILRAGGSGAREVRGAIFSHKTEKIEAPGVATARKNENTAFFWGGGGGFTWTEASTEDYSNTMIRRYLPVPHLGGQQRHGDGERDADCAVEVQDSDGLYLHRERAAKHSQAPLVVRHYTMIPQYS